jgi:hypothetical protein
VMVMVVVLPCSGTAEPIKSAPPELE